MANREATKAMANDDIKKQAKAKKAPSVEQWLALLANMAMEAMQAGNFAEANKLTSQASKLQAQAKIAELESKKQAVAGSRNELEFWVSVTIYSVLGESLFKLIDGVWYSFDKASNELSLSLFKPSKQTATTRASGDYSKKFNVSNEALLAAHGNELSRFELAGKKLTYNEAYAKLDELAKAYNRERKNVLHGGIREPLLKLAGYK